MTESLYSVMMKYLLFVQIILLLLFQPLKKLTRALTRPKICLKAETVKSSSIIVETLLLTDSIIVPAKPLRLPQ